MTITLKPWSIGVLIATFAVLIGFAVGQVTASDAGGSASYSRTTPVQDKGVAAQVKALNKNITTLFGDKYASGSVLGQLHDILENTGYTCRGVWDGGPVCNTFD